MHGQGKITIVEILVIVGVLAILVLFFIPTFEDGGIKPRVMCMNNLRSINSATVLYKSANDGAFPWLYDTMTAWDTTPVGTNRNVSPFGAKDDPNNPRPRSITTLMFMLVRQDQPPGMFRCPSDRNARVDYTTKATQDDGDKASGILEGEYYWDFSRPENVSYSWQAPRWKDGRFTQGIDPNQTDTVVIADMTPRYGWDEKWVPIPITDQTRLSRIERQITYNHRGERVNILREAGNVEAKHRPDVGMDNDNIYTASGNPRAGSRSATSLDIFQHLSTRDTFLIGPVGRAEAE